MALVRGSAAGSSSDQDASSVRYLEGMVAFANGELHEARQLAREARGAYSGTDAMLAGELAARVSLLLRDGAGVADDRGWLNDTFRDGARLEKSMRSLEAGELALAGQTGESAQAYRRVIDEMRAASFHLDLGLALFERSWLLGSVDEQAAAGLDEARAVFTAMGADAFIERLMTGAVSPPVLPGAAAAPAAVNARRASPTALSISDFAG
jgi:hypothetical protein